MVKNLKISEEHHKMLKEHCKKHGLKMFAYIERLIVENCSEETDLYDE